jgi:hypothetical protein
LAFFDIGVFYLRMWTCPKCSALLVQKNLSHSCGNYTVEGFLKGKPERGKQLFWHLIGEFEKIGPVKLHPVKTRVAIMIQVRFAAVYHIGRGHIDGHLWLKQRVDHQRFRRIEHLGKDDFLHHFRIGHENEIDDRFREIMRIAREIGQRQHVGKNPPRP